MVAWLRYFNYAPFCAGYVRAWGADIYHPSFDRWLYLVLNRWGLQGRVSRRVIESWVKPGDVAIDIGGNIGLYTALLSRCVGPSGKVVAFEPVHALHASLERTIAMNRLSNVEISSYALGARLETARVLLDPLNSGNNWLSHGASSLGVPVPVHPLDAMEMDRAPTFIKIDVQGWEVEVLRGMERILAGRPSPVLYCEVSEPALRTAGSSSAQLGQILLDHGYSLQVATMEKGRLALRQLSVEELTARASHTLYFDVLAIPPGHPAPAAER